MARDKIPSNLLRRFRKYKTKRIDYSATSFQIYLKYKGVCQNCQCKTNLGLHDHADTTATIEHIIPLSDGGNHTWDNVTLFCQKCNFDKEKFRVAEKKRPVNANDFGFVKLFRLWSYTIYAKKDT